MQVNSRIFRGYDIRGLVGEDLNSEIAEHLGRAHGTLLQKAGISEAVVAHDCRITSPEYSQAIIRGLNGVGVDVIDIGLTMVGTFYWAQYFLNCKGGVFVTASHNPAEYNGFKMADGFSETLVSDSIQKVRQLVESGDYFVPKCAGTTSERDIHEDYYADLLKRFNIKKKLKIVVDPSNTTAGILMPELLRRAGCEVIEKNCNVDGTFPLGTPDPTEKRVADRLSQEVLESGADLGFSFDADGDRIGIVDDKGGIIWNDVLLALFSVDVLARHPGAKIMFNILCSKVVTETIKKNGGVPFMWRTGHSFLKKKNQEVGAAFIGELSGHFFFSADFYNHDDGCYSALRLVDYLVHANKKLSEVVDSLPKYISSPEIKLFCKDEEKVVLMKKISPMLKNDFLEAEVIDDERAGDGVRLDMDDSMFVVRYSQNGPYITVKFEGQTKDRYEELRKYINKLLHSFPEVDWSHKINVNHEALE